MQPILNTQREPFNSLNNVEKELIKNSTQISFFNKGDLVLKKNTFSDFVYIIFRGKILQLFEKENLDNLEEEEIHGYFTNEDLFGFRFLEQESQFNYIAFEDTLCFTLSKKDFLLVCHSSFQFYNFFYSGLESKKWLAEQSQKEDMSYTNSLISDFDIRKSIVLKDTATMDEVAQTFIQQSCNCIFIIQKNETRIITKTDFIKMFDAHKNINNLQAWEAGSKNIISIQEECLIFDALLLMTKYHIERIAVTKDNKIIGSLELKDILHVFTNLSFSLGTKIEKAESIEELLNIVKDFNYIIHTFEAQGIKIENLMEIMHAISVKLLRKVIVLSLDKEIIEKSCFFIMGSEGRHEQIIKTDQDNAIIFDDSIADKIDREKLKNIVKIFEKLGYPLCKGNIMISNEFWADTQSGWKTKITQWLNKKTMTDIMNMAIFIDSYPVSGNRTLLFQIKDYLFEISRKDKIFFSYFAKPAIQFQSPFNLFGGLKKKKGYIDVKKVGIFPIVHGVRSLAFQNNIKKNATLTRIKRLEEAKVLPKKLARDLAEALKVFIQLRVNDKMDLLKKSFKTEQNKDQQNIKQIIFENHNLINVEELSSLDRDLLHEALHITNKFKEFITNHFQLHVIP